jgi:hypothetical protein
VTPFCFDHVFRAGSPEDLVASFFDDGCQAEQDRVLGIVERTVLERGDGRRVCRVVPNRTLPLIGGALHYVESVTRRGDDLAIEIRPSVGRVVLTATYQLEQVGHQAIRRRYAGAVSVNIALIGGRLERGIVEELGRSLPAAAASTQAWLDGDPAIHVSWRLNQGNDSGIIGR